MSTLHFYILLLLSFLPLASYAQTIKIKKPVREIRTVNLYEDANKPFSRRNGELMLLVFDGIKKGEIMPVFVDLSGQEDPVILSQEAWTKKIAYKESEEYYKILGYQLIFPTDIKYIGVDLTCDQQTKQQCQVNYLHFYPAEQISETEQPEYRFSVRWDDLIDYVEGFPELLYYTNSWKIWWRNEAIVTNSYYAVDDKLGQALIRLSKSTGTMPARDTSGNLIVIPENNSGKSLPNDVYIIESERTPFSPEKIGIIQYTASHPFTEIARFEFLWQDFLKIAQDSGWLEKKPVMAMAEALYRNLFSYASLPALQVSKNGRFINGNKDPLCNKIIKASFTKSPASELVAYSVEHWDLISTLEPKNKPLIKLPELIYEYVLSGKLTPYFTDSLNRVMNMEELKGSAARCFTAPEFTRESSYRKGDIVAVDTDNFFYSYFIALQNIGQKGKLPTHSRSWKAYQPPLFPSSELYLIDLKSNVSYNQHGQKERYQLQGLGLYIPHDAQINERGIMLPICYVKWEELKNLLIMDERNKLNLKGAETSMTELLENRGFFSIFLKTSHLKP